MDLKDIPFASYREFLIWQADQRLALVYKKEQAVAEGDALLVSTLTTKIAEIDEDFKQLKVSGNSPKRPVPFVDTLTSRPTK